MTMAEGRAMSEPHYTLIIGDKNFSSWSLRPWLAMARAGIPFAEERIRLRQPESKAAILRHSPSGKVPALKTNGLVVCRQPRHSRISRRAPPRAFTVAARPRGAGRGALGLRRDAFRLHGASQRHVHGPLDAVPDAADQRGPRGRHPPHRLDLARGPSQAWRQRPIPVRRFLQRRRHVRAGRHAVPHLWRRPR